MFLDAILRLYTYTDEMNRKVFDAASGLSPEQFTAPVVEGQPSIRDTLVHLVDAHTCWETWWDGRMSREDSFGRVFPVEHYPDVESIRSWWNEVHADTMKFIDVLAEVDLEKVYTRTRQDGTMVDRHLWEMMLHVANHGTQHRSEVAVMLTALGHSPGDLDIL